jgi:broad specificity phosphatase PhoE
MIAPIVGLIVNGLASLVFMFTGWFDACVNALLCIVYRRHKQIRFNQRPLRIFLIRHGESEANIDKSKSTFLFSSSIFIFNIALYTRIPDSQIELTEEGHKQARAAGEKLRSIIGNESVYVYMSPYRRSKQTWINIRKALSPSQIITEREEARIREQEFGNIGDLTERTQEIDEQHRLGEFFYRFSCGESGADVCDRASLFLDTLFREMDNGYHDPTKNIVVVSHGLFMRLFLMRYFRWTVEQLENYKQFGNCEICQLTKVDGIYTLDERTGPPMKPS